MSALYRRINQQQEICRKIKLIFSKLSKSSFQPTLQKALSGESTYIFEHINRLKLMKSSLVSLSIKIGKPLKAKRIKNKRFSFKSRSNKQDKQIIKFALRLFETMNKDLSAINKLNLNVEQPIIKTLVEQTIQENADSIQWLNNINYNVLSIDG